MFVDCELLMAVEFIVCEKRITNYGVDAELSRTVLLEELFGGWRGGIGGEILESVGW